MITTDQIRDWIEAKPFRQPNQFSLRKNETGNVYGRLTVREYSHTKDKRAFWKCQCACGNSCIISGKSMRRGVTQSCGCFHKEEVHKRFFKHGHSPSKIRSPEYDTWANMKQRCLNTNHSGYSFYGGRGIKLCEAWKNFKGFYRDMGNRPQGMSIDRIDVNGNYEPGNCKWATDKEQTNNRRPMRRIEDFSDAELRTELERRTLRND